jgi:hypothetical protein
MKDNAQLYEELQSEINAIVEHLFDASEVLLKKNDNFLPHGVALTNQKELEIVLADPGGDQDATTSDEVLPVLHEAMRAKFVQGSIEATGVAENVTISTKDSETTEAIKVMFEHRKGLTIAFYLPFKKKFLRGYSFGETIVMYAEPEVGIA